MSSWLNTLAYRYPRLLSGMWFGGSAAILVTPVAAMALLLIVMETTHGRQNDSHLPFLCAVVLLPILLALIVGSISGSIIFKITYGWAAIVGGLTGFSTFLLWVVFLEFLPRIFWMVAGGGSESGVGGDVPGAAEVVAYFVILPTIVVLSILFGAAAGVLMRCTKSLNY